MNRLSVLSICVWCVLSQYTYAQNSPIKTSTTPEKPEPAHKTPASSDAAGTNLAAIDTAQKQTFYQKYGRPPDVSLIPFSAWNAYTNSSWGFAEWRTDNGGRLHAGVDFGTGGRVVPLRAPEDTQLILLQNGGIMMQRDGSYKDRILYVHAKAGRLRLGRVSKGTVVGALDGFTTSGAREYSSIHDHYEYHVLKNNPIRTARIPIFQQSQVVSSRNNTTGQGTFLTKGYVAVDPTPYWQYDMIRANPATTGTSFGRRYTDFAYLGNTFRTKYNALYNKQLPIGQFEPHMARAKVILPSKTLPSTLLNQANRYINMPLTEDMLAMANTTALHSAMQAETAGFDMGGGVWVSQRVLASSFSDDDGEPWQAIFGNGDFPDLKEMSERQLISFLVSKRYGNPEWVASLAKLSTKGLLSEYLSIQAEKNYLMHLLTQAKLDTMKQEAVLVRTMLHSKDKAVEALFESIQASVAPDFLLAELEAAGDEWLQTGRFVGEGGVSLEEIDFGDISGDLDKLTRALLDALSGHESNGSYNAFNDGTICRKYAYTGQAPHSYAPITQMTPAQILTRYYGMPSGSGESAKVPCSRRLFAVGKYQWIPKTLSEMIHKPANRKYLHTPFTPQVQEQIALSFFSAKRPSIGVFIKTGKGKNQALRSIAHEWASIAVPKGYSTQSGKISSGCDSARSCMTYYDSGRGNRAFFESTQKVWAIMDAIEQFHLQS